MSNLPRVTQPNCGRVWLEIQSCSLKFYLALLSNDTSKTTLTLGYLINIINGLRQTFLLKRYAFLFGILDLFNRYRGMGQ